MTRNRADAGRNAETTVQPRNRKHDMLLTLALLIFALVLAVFVAAQSKPDSFRVERSLVMAAAPEKIFALINDFRDFGRWSPWEKLDPAMKRTLSGPPTGVGAVHEWSGNAKAGAGRMEIIESTPVSKIVMKLDFIKPFEGHNTAIYTLKPQGEATNVSWEMHGQSTLITKVMQVFVSMDKLLGKDFEEGLRNMKGVVEDSHKV
jgi:uncharacterized protein YndB with AHSA1/START domain